MLKEKKVNLTHALAYGQGPVEDGITDQLRRGTLLMDCRTSKDDKDTELGRIETA